MSGGSYNYLCRVGWAAETIHELTGPSKRFDLEKMAERLERLGWANDAAKETVTLIADLNAATIRAEVAAERLRDVWKAVEWWDSGDWGEESVRLALVDYRGLPPGGTVTS